MNYAPPYAMRKPFNPLICGDYTMAKNRCTLYLVQGTDDKDQSIEMWTELAKQMLTLGTDTGNGVKRYRSWRTAFKQIAKLETEGRASIVVSVRVRGIVAESKEEGNVDASKPISDKSG
jgi:hypothetical protein